MRNGIGGDDSDLLKRLEDRGGLSDEDFLVPAKGGAGVSDEEFIRFAITQRLLTADEADRCYAAAMKTRRPAADVAVSLGLFGADDLQAAVRAMEGSRAEPAPKACGNKAPSAPQVFAEREASPEQCINGRYRIVRQLGKGGMGRVYLVMDSLRAGRTLALKTLLKQRLMPEAEREFQSEFRILASVRHPNIETVYDYGKIEAGPGEDMGSLFFTCEHLHGKDLLEATEGMGWREVVPLLVQLCRALQFIHARELVHHDIKPQNVLVCVGAGGAHVRDPEQIGVSETRLVKIVDFGLTAPRLATPGFYLKGSLPYMSPEVIGAQPADHRADLYSLGATMYHVLTRRFPYDAKTVTEMMRAHLEGTLQSLRQTIPDLPQELDALVLRLMHRNPANRPSSAGEVVRLLGRVSGEWYDLETKATLRGYVRSGALVGRDRELEWLKDLWNKANKGQEGSRVAVVSGESGIGKSRLVQEFRLWMQTRGVFVAQAGADKGAEETFGLARELLEQVVAEVEARERSGRAEKGLVGKYAAHAKEIVPLLGLRYGVAGIPKLEEEQELVRLLDKTSEFVLKVAGAAGMVLVVEDAECADEMSVRLVEFVGRKAALGAEGGRLLLVMTKGPGEQAPELEKVLARLVSDGHAQQRVLEPLSREEEERLVRTMFGEGAGAVVEKLASAQSGGNPYFLEELLKEWVEQGILQWWPWGWEVDSDKWKEAELPRNVQEVIGKRLLRLDAKERSFLERLAIWEGPAGQQDMQLLAESGSPNAYSGTNLTGLVRDGLLRRSVSQDAVTYGLAHSGIRRALVEAMTSERLRVLSAELLDRLERDILAGRRAEEQEMERLARLAWDGEEKRKYVKYGEAAARLARKRYALVEARDAYRRLLDIDLPGDKRTEILEALGDVSLSAGLPAEAERCFKQVIEGARESSEPSMNKPGASTPLLTLARIRRKHGNVANRTGRPAEAERLFEQALAEVRTLENGASRGLEEARTLIDLAWLRGLILDRPEEAERFVREAITVCRCHPGEADYELHRAYHVLADLESERGNLTGALAMLEEELRFWEGRNEKDMMAAALASCGTVYSRMGQLDRAMEQYSGALSLFEATGHRAKAAIMLMNLGLTYGSKGECERSLEYYRRAAATLAEIGDRRGMTFALTGIADLYRVKGEHDRALEYYRKSMTISEELGDARGLAVAACGMASVCRDKGDLDGALEFLQKALVTGEKRRDPSLLVRITNDIGEIHRARGEFDRALECFRKSMAIAEEAGAIADVGISANSMGNIFYATGDLARARACYQKSMTIAEERGFKQGTAASASNLGRVCLSMGEMAQALVYFRKSMAMSEDLGIVVSVADSACDLGDANLVAGDLDRALESYEKAMTISKKSGYQRGVAKSALGVGHVCMAKGELEKALAMQDFCMNLNRRMGWKGGMYDARVLFAELAIARKDFSAAREACEEGIAAATEMNSPWMIACEHSRMATIDREDACSRVEAGPHRTGADGAAAADRRSPDRELLQRALANHEKTLAFAREKKLDDRDVAAIERELALDCIELGRKEEAWQHLEQVRGALSMSQNLAVAASVLEAMARWEMAFGDRNAAVNLYSRLISLLRQKGYSRQVRELEARIGAEHCGDDGPVGP